MLRIVASLVRVTGQVYFLVKVITLIFFVSQGRFGVDLKTRKEKISIQETVGVLLGVHADAVRMRHVFSSHVCAPSHALYNENIMRKQE